MVRETRYLLVGNLPETTTEDEITEYFKRFGKIQKVKLERKPDGSSDSDEKEEGCITSLTATVAFTDIKSASNAHKAEKKIGNNVLSSEYSSGFGATGSVVKRTHEPEIFPRAPPPPGPFPPRKGFEEEDGFDAYYGPTPIYSELSYPGSPFPERGRPRERWVPGGPIPGRGAKWMPGPSRQFSDSSKDAFEKPKTASVPASSPASHTSSKRSKKKKKSKSTERSRSRSSASNSSRSSSSDSESGSQSSSKERGKSAVASMGGKDARDSEIEPGEREPLGILIRKLPLRSSDTSLRDGLFHEYKKYGKITAVQVSGANENRYAIISFKQAEDAAKALNASGSKRFFGSQIVAEQHEGLEGEDGDFLTPEAQLDEHSPKATRTLFLGNLDKEITIEELKERLEKYGDILDVDVKRQGAITAYAFIQFTDITSVVKALKDLDGTTWGATKLKVGFGKSMATPVVWLGNLADTVHEGFLFKQFARFGALSHTVVDRENHKGLVFFMNVESAQYALPEMRNRIWNGKKIHIDYASRDCQEAFYKKMEQSGQLRPGERPDARSMQKKLAENPHWEEGGFDPNFKSRGGFNQFGRGRGRFQRGRGGFFRGRGGPSFEGPYPPDEFALRKRQLDEYSQGSSQFIEDDYEKALRDYNKSQRERHERASQSPPPYDDMYYERTSQSGHDYDQYEKHRFASYRSASPGSDRELDIADEEFRYKRTPSDERYSYYKEKLYEEGRVRERSHSSDSEQHYRLPSEIMARRSRSRSPTLKEKRKDLPISYRSHTPPTPTEEEGYYPSDNSPTDFDSAYRKKYKRPSSGSVEGDRKSGVLVNTGLRREIESKSEERASRKRSYDQLSPKRSDSYQIERQLSRGSRADSLYELDRVEKLSAKELIAKVQRLRAEVNERLGVKDSPSSSSNSDIDPSTLTESDLLKLHSEKQMLLQKLTLFDESGNLSGNDSDSRHRSSKKPRVDLKYLQAKQEKRHKIREYKKSKSASDVKKDFMDYSEEDSFSVNSPRDFPPGLMPKKRRKVESESERKSRSYRARHDDQAGFSSDEEKDRNDVLRQTSAHGDTYSKSRTSSSLDARLESAEFSSHSREESRRVSSGSDNNKEHSEHLGHSRRRHKKRDNHITPLIPLGDDSMPDPETTDPRPRCEKCERPMELLLPDFAQFIQFSPLPSPHHSPERCSDLRPERGRDKMSDTAYQSPCFSPQSSSSKTHSPSQSPSGSGSDTKANTNSDSGSGEIPLGFPKEPEQIDPEANKADSLDSVPDPTKSPEKSKQYDDSFSDNNSDIENLSADNLSIEERIRQLDEKWNKAQAVAAATPKVVPDVDNLVNSVASGSPLLTPFTTAPVIATASASPTTSSLYSKFRIRKRNDATGSGTDKGDGPSEIVQTVLSKSSIFDQDSKRLGQHDDLLDSNKETSPTNGNSPKLSGAWNKPEVKEISPMVTLPGSLLDRLGPGNNGSFPTLPLNTPFSSATSGSMCRTDSFNQNIYTCDSRISKLSPLPSLDIPIVNDKIGLSLSPLSKDEKLLQKVDNDITGNSPKIEKNGLGLDSDSKKKDPEKSPVMPKSILKNRSNSDISSIDTSIFENGTDLSVKEEHSYDIKTEKKGDDTNLKEEDIKDKTVNYDQKLDLHSPKINGDIVKIEKGECEVSETKSDKSAKVENEHSCQGDHASLSTSKIKDESTSSTSIKAETEENKTTNDVTKSVKKETIKAEDEKMETDEIKSEHKLESVKEEIKPAIKTENTDVKMEVDPPQDNVKVEQSTSSSKSPSKDKHSSKSSSKDSTSKEPSHKKQKLSKDGKEKRSDSSHKDDKHKKKDADKKSDSSHKSSSEKKDEKHKDKHKSKSDKEKKDSDKKLKDEKKENKDKKKTERKDKDKKEVEKDVKDDKSDKHSKEKKEDKVEDKKPSSSKEDENKDSKEKSVEKKEKSEKKHEKKEGHKHDKHSTKSPDKKSKSSQKKEETKVNKESEEKPKESPQKETTPKEGTIKESEKDKKDIEKEKQEKEKSDKKSSESSSSSKKEHRSSSSHKSKKSKDETSSNTKSSKEDKTAKNTKVETNDIKKSPKEEENKKVKDDHSEHKKKDEVSDRNNKDSPDKNKDANRKESVDKKSSEKTKDKSNGSDKCKEDNTKNKEKENKDKDPDHSKSKGNGNNPSTSSEPVEKSKSQLGDTAKTDKSKAETDKDESKKSESKKDDSKKDESKKDDKKSNKDTDMFKNLNAFTKKSSKDTDMHKKNSQKMEKSGKGKEEKKDSKPKDKSDTDNKSKKDSSKNKKKEEPVVYNGLTEEDLAIFAKFADESSLSMYAKVKRRSTEKKLHHDKETEEQKKLLSEYKKNQKCSKKLSLSDITESSEVSSDEENRMKSTPKNRKKFAFSSDDSESSTDTGADILQKKNKAKLQAKKPKRILDIYSSDSEEEMSIKTPSKSSSSTKKKKADVHRENDNKFEFDSISDSDNKSSATQQAKVKTKPKTEKKQSKTKSDSKSQPKNEKKEDQKPKKPKLKRKDLSFKDLFSDDSDDSMLSDSDSDSDIMISSKAKKNALPAAKTDKNKKILPRGSSIYTSSEDSGSDEGFKPMSPPKTTMLPKKNDKKINNVFKSPNRKDPESDSMTSDTEVKNEKNKKMLKNCVQNNYENSLDSDSFISEPEISKTNEVKVIPDVDKSLKKIRAEKSREQIEKDLHKFNNNKKIHDIITDDPRYSSLSKLDIAKVYSETVYEKDSLLSNLTNKNNLPPILTDINKEPLFKLDADSVRNDIPTLKDINFDDKSGKIKNKKHKKENKKKKKNKEKSSKDSVRDTSLGINSKYTDLKQEIHSQKNSSSENLMQDSDLENLNAVNRNLFDDMKGVKSPEGKRSINKKDSKTVIADKEEILSQPERLTDSDFTDSEKKKTPKSERPELGSVSNKEKPSDLKKSLNSDVFDFQEEENKVKPIKESHMKVIKPDAYDVHLSDHEADNASNVPVEIQGVEIEYRSEEQDYKDEGFNICPVVETTEVVIENVGNDSAEREKPKQRKKKGRKNSGKDNDLTEEAVSSLNKEDKTDSTLNTANLTSINVQFEAPVSNENELIIDEGASLHVEDETEKAVESICNDETDETAKAVESILMDGIPGYTISEPVEPTPTLDQNYLQPDFAPSLPNTVPQVGTEVETATTNSPLRGKKGGRKGKRTKSGQSDILLPEIPINKPFDLLGDSSLASDLSTSLDQNDDDDDDDGKLQIDFDPPKPELKQKKPRKPKQSKVNKMNDAAALAAENKLDNLFGNFSEEKKDELNRDSLSSENSELERSKHEDLLFIDREDQRHDSDLMSPDERSTSDDLTSPDMTKPKPKRGRKPKNKEQVTATIPRTNSPRANSRTLSPRSPRNNFDPKSPEPKLNGPKNLIIDEGNKLGTNVFDFDENDESNSNISSTPTTTGGKQRKPRQKKKGEPGLQSPESRSLFSSPENNDRLVIGSPESKCMFSPEHKAQIPAWDKKALFSPNFQPEEQKLEVKNVADDKPPEPLFKAFFEAKSKTEKDADKANPLLARRGVMSPKDGELKAAANAKVLSNVDKTIEDVSKGLFESTDDEGTNANEPATQKKCQVKKTKEDDIKSPLRSPLPKSPLKSPVMNHMHSPPPSMPHQQPLVLPGMGIGQPTIQAPIGEPQVAGPISMYGPMSSPPPRTPVSEVTKGVSIAHSSPVFTSALLSHNKSMGIMSVAQTTSATSVLASTTSVAQDLRKMDGATESMLKSSMTGFLIPGISASSAVSVLQGIATTSSSAPTSVVTSSMSDPSKQPPPPYMENLSNDQQQQQAAEQQKILDQKQAELQLQRQQEHHVKLKEMELKKQMEHKKMLEEQHKKLQEQMKTKEIQEQQMKNREEMMKKEQEKKRLEEHFKMLHEQLQKQQALAAGIPMLTGAPPSQQELLSPGSLQRQRPGLPSPSADKGAPRPPVSAHHQMPAGAPFGLPGALQIRPGQFPPHLTPAQIQVMQQHLVSPLGSDKPPTNAELALKHQQLQQQIVAQAQKAQAQAMAEQQAQIAKQQATQAKQGSQQVAQGKAGKGGTATKKAIEMQHPPTSQGMGVPVVHGKDGGPLPGSQEAANQLTAQIKQQLAMQQAQQQAQAHASHLSHPGSHGGPQQGPQGVGSWPPVPHRQEGPRQPGPPQGPILGETRSSMPGPVPVIGGNPQQVQRVSPNPPNKSPTVAQTAPNMVLGFSQHQTAAPRAPSPAVAKTAVVFPQASERQTPQGKWPGGAGQPRPSPPDVRPRPPSSEAGPPASRPDIWGPGVNGPVGISMNATPRPAHQQQPDTLQLKRVLGAPDRPPVNEKFLQQQHEKHFQELQRQEFLKHQQEIQRQQQLRDQALHAQAQKEVQIHKEREEREKREAQANQVGSDPRQSPAIRMGYPFVEPRPPSHDGGKMQQSPAIVDPRDPRFSQAFPGHHPDLRMGSSQASAFSPAAGNSGDPSHMYTQAELQRIQNGLIPTYPPSLLMRDPHLIPGHAPPYMLPGHLAYMAQQMEHQHLVDGRPPSRGTSRPPSNQPVHTVSPTQQAPGDRNQNRGQGQTMGPPSRDPHPGDGSLLSLLQRYPVMWQGVLGLKNDQCVVQMHFISGFQPLVKMSLPQQAPDGTVQPLRIAQRMRLEQAQLEGVAKRMQMEKDYCMMLALPCGRDHTDIYQQTRAMSTGFIQYLQQKQAAGIVNVADPGSQQPAYVVHIFPPCDFSQTTLSRLGFDLLYQVKDLAHLIVIIATVA